jgi:hypothetical protein
VAGLPSLAPFGRGRYRTHHLAVRHAVWHWPIRLSWRYGDRDREWHLERRVDVAAPGAPWGMVLGSIQVLPRIGYGKPDPQHPATWACTNDIPK